MTKYYVDQAGSYLGGWDGGRDADGIELDHPDVPVGAVEIASPPVHAADVWTGSAWDTVRRATWGAR